MVILVMIFYFHIANISQMGPLTIVVHYFLEGSIIVNVALLLLGKNMNNEMVLSGLKIMPYPKISTRLLTGHKPFKESQQCYNTLRCYGDTCSSRARLR